MAIAKTVELVVDRFKLAADHTLGRLMLSSSSYLQGPPFAVPVHGTEPGKFLCLTLEDIYRPVKVPGQTRIPEGRYEIKLRPEGGKYQKWLGVFGDWQKPGMLWITNVPGFEWILMHPGVSNKDTEGCLLVGDGYLPLEGILVESRHCYERVYKPIAERLVAGEKVYITYEDNDR